MKITRLQTFLIKPGWMILKIATDEDIVGFGEFDLSGPPRALETVTQELGSFLCGEDPGRIEALWQAMYRGVYHRGGPIYFSAVSAIEQALWDIKGKRLGVPVYELLGGACRHKIRLQARAGGDSPSDAASVAKGLRVKQYKSIKITIDTPVRNVDSKAFVDRQVARLAAVREEVGDEVDVAINFNGRFGPAMAARVINALECHCPYFVEEPCPPENPSALVKVSQSTSTPLAVGNRMHTRWAFREILEAQAAAVVQPDVAQVGGILEAKKVAAMAETYYASVAPLNPRGPVSLAASLQLAASIPNFLVLEHPALGSRWDVGHGLLEEPFETHGGYIPLPEAPGLGITLREEALRERAISIDWKPDFRNYPDDGSVADW